MSQFSAPRLVARFPKMRALAWSGRDLYASRGYDLLRASLPGDGPQQDLQWTSVASYQPTWWRSLSCRSRLSARLVRDGFHALCVLSSGGLVGAVPGAIVTLNPGDKTFRRTHQIIRGTRPLHITSAPNGTAYWGEYFDNPAREEVHIFASVDQGETWNVAYTFPKGAIRHVHNVVHDPWENCLWVLTGDYGDECRILRADVDFRHIDTVLQGNQQARAVAMVPASDGLHFSSDTPLETNHIYCLDRRGNLSQLTQISSSSIYGCRVGEQIFFSTMVEPSEANTDQCVRLYGSTGETWQPVLAWKKDFWPMRFFQYGNAFLPDGDNGTHCLAVTTIAVEHDDMVTSLYAIDP